MKKLPLVLTPFQCGQLCREITNLKHRTMITLMYEGALRLSELSNIRIEHVKDGEIFIQEGKGAKDRLVPVTARTMQLLREYWKRYRPGVGRAYLFPSKSSKDRPYATRTLQYEVAKAAHRANIGRHVNCHLLRHSRATHLLNAGMNLYDLSVILGHARITTTSIYLHTATEHLKDVARQMDEIIFKAAGN